MNKKITPIKLQKFLLNALTERYNSDGCCPGITVSKLKNGTYYVSICRYLQPFGGDKRVIMKATAKKLTEALRSVAEKWLRQNNFNTKTARENLQDYIGFC